MYRIEETTRRITIISNTGEISSVSLASKVESKFATIKNPMAAPKMETTSQVNLWYSPILLDKSEIISLDEVPSDRYATQTAV